MICAFKMLAMAKMSSKKAVPICIPASGVPVHLPTLRIVSHFTFLPISWAENDSLYLSFAFVLLLVRMNVFFVSSVRVMEGYLWLYVFLLAVLPW